MNIFDEAEKNEKEVKNIILFKKFIYISIVVGFVSIISLVCYKHYKGKMQNNSFEMVDLLLKSDKDEQTLSTLNQILELSKNHVKDLAAIKIAQTQFRLNKPNDAKELLYMIITGNYQEITKSYAKLLWVSYNLDNFDVNTQNDKINMRDLFAQTDDEKNVFYGQYNILKALWLVKENHKQEAVDMLKNLTISSNLTLECKKIAQTILHHVDVH